MTATGWEGLTDKERRSAANHWIKLAASISIVIDPPTNWAAPAHVTLTISPQNTNPGNTPPRQ